MHARGGRIFDPMRYQRHRVVLLGFLFWGLAGPLAQGQDNSASTEQPAVEEADLTPPQILTSDLYRRTITQLEQIDATWVFVDDREITTIRVNGAPQTITPGRLVVLQKRFELERLETLIEVEVLDASSNLRESSYLVILRESLLDPLPSQPNRIPYSLDAPSLEKLLGPAQPSIPTELQPSP